MIHVYRHIPQTRPYETFVYVTDPDHADRYLFICGNVCLEYFSYKNTPLTVLTCVIPGRITTCCENDSTWDCREQMYRHGPRLARAAQCETLFEALKKEGFQLNGDDNKLFSRVRSPEKPLKFTPHNYSKIYITLMPWMHIREDQLKKRIL